MAIIYPLAYDKDYADCVRCDKTFIVDKYTTYNFCNYCKGSLIKR